MTENIVPIITDVGKILGRDAIFLDSVHFVNESTFELTGEFNGTLCTKLLDNEVRKFKISFRAVHLFKMTELDFDEIEYQSSFDLIENSNQIFKMISYDKTNHIGKIDNTYKHFVFRTYDTVFEIVGKDFELVLE